MTVYILNVPQPTDWRPNPFHGSPEAIAQGCTCPIRQPWPEQLAVDADCPVHELEKVK